MTEKRFTFMQDTLVKADVFDNEEFVCCTLSVWVEQLVDLLNKLHEEKEQLEKENMELKKELDSFNPVVFNDMLKGTVILYNKGDVE